MVFTCKCFILHVNYFSKPQWSQSGPYRPTQSFQVTISRDKKQITDTNKFEE